MIPTSYTYNISVSFPNKIVASDVLQQEIQTSTIIVAIDHIDTRGDYCIIWFADKLSQDDENMLDHVIAVHQGVEPIVAVCPTCGRPL